MPYLANPAFSQPEPVAHIRLQIPPPSPALLLSPPIRRRRLLDLWISSLSLSVPLCRPAETRPSFSRALSPPPLHTRVVYGGRKLGGGRSRGTHFSHFRPNNQIYCIRGMNSSTGSSVCTSTVWLSISHSLCLHGIAAAAPLLLISAAARSLSLAALAAAAEFSCTLLASQGSTSDTEPHGTSFRHE